MLEAVAPSCLSISPWRAMGIPFMLSSILFEVCRSGPVYYFCMENDFKRKGEARLTAPPISLLYLGY